jgi:hypothetical protein
MLIQCGITQPVSGNSLPSGHPSPDKSLQNSTLLSVDDYEPSTTPATSSRVGQFLRNPFTHQRNSPSPSYTPSSPALGSELVSDDERKLQISVLVAMPTPNKEINNVEDQVVPDVVIGVVQVPYGNEDRQQQQQD